MRLPNCKFTLSEFWRLYVAWRSSLDVRSQDFPAFGDLRLLLNVPRATDSALPRSKLVHRPARRGSALAYDARRKARPNGRRLGKSRILQSAATVLRGPERSVCSSECRGRFKKWPWGNIATQ